LRFGDTGTMNILIVGNGFDLSHYLPTKYDHFMLVMKAIEKKDLDKPINDVLYSPFEHPIHLVTKYFQISKALDKKTYQMDFDELFSQFKQPKDIEFIGNTKKNYDVSNIHLTKIQVQEIQKQLQQNGWYSYFKHHVQEIKTWIDFEQKIEDVLVVVARCIVDLESMDHRDKIINYLNNRGQNSLKIKTKDLDTLNFFNFTIKNEGVMIPFNLNMDFCHGKNVKNGFSSADFMTFLYTELEKFIEIFNVYLEIIVGQLSQSKMIDIDAEWSYPDKIFSFNYTNTYQRLHDAVDVEYLHGSCGNDQNIVLGVSDLESESLKKIKAYGFTKYQQKLFKDTDFLFLDKYKAEIRKDKIEIEALKRQVMMPLGERYVRSLHEVLSEKERDQFLNLNFYIWGHSLDISDKDYIIDLFSLNDDMDRNVRVTVYYYDPNAKFSLLNNLLAILKKDKVEQWMKNKWLQFKKNPEIKFGEIISEKTA
jgi:predicted DNA-binding ArsR family transcriptional regulator